MVGALLRIRGHDERGGGRRVRRGHRRATRARVHVHGRVVRRHDTDTGRGHVDVAARARERRPGAVRVDRGDGDRGVVRSRVGRFVRARTTVASRGDDEHAIGIRVRDRVPHAVRWRSAAEAQVDDACAVLHGPHDAGRDVAGLPAAVGGEHAHGQDANAGCRAGNAAPVLRRRRDHAGDMGPVAVRIDASVAPAHEIQAGKHHAGEILVITAHAGVDDRDDDAGPVGRRPRRLERRLVERPLLRAQRIARTERMHRHLGFDREDLVRRAPERVVRRDGERVVAADDLDTTVRLPHQRPDVVGVGSRSGTGGRGERAEQCAGAAGGESRAPRTAGPPVHGAPTHTNSFGVGRGRLDRKILVPSTNNSFSSRAVTASAGAARRR